jgi:hypothetical protein
MEDGEDCSMEIVIKYYYYDRIKENELGEPFSTYGNHENETYTEFHSKTCKKATTCEDIIKINLRQIRWNHYIGFILLTIGELASSCEHGNEHLG